MKTGLKKCQKTTDIYFDEQSPVITVRTYNTALKRRLTAYAEKYPECCQQTDDDECGCLIFEIEKGRLSFRLTAPYSEERRRKASSYAKRNGIVSQRTVRLASAPSYDIEEENIDDESQHQ